MVFLRITLLLCCFLSPIYSFVATITKETIEDHIRQNTTNLFLFIGNNCLECDFVLSQFKKAEDQLPPNSIGVTMGVVDLNVEGDLGFVFDVAYAPTLIRLADGHLDVFSGPFEISRIQNFAFEWACKQTASGQTHISPSECKSVLGRYIEAPSSFKDLEIPFIRCESCEMSINVFEHPPLTLTNPTEMISVLTKAEGLHHLNAVEIVRRGYCYPDEYQLIQPKLFGFCDILLIYAKYDLHVNFSGWKNIFDHFGVISMASNLYQSPSVFSNPSLDVLQNHFPYTHTILLVVHNAKYSPPQSFIDNKLSLVTKSLGPLPSLVITPPETEVLERLASLYDLHSSLSVVKQDALMDMFLIEGVHSNPKVFVIPPPPAPFRDAQHMFEHISSHKRSLRMELPNQRYVNSRNVISLAPLTIDTFIHPPHTPVDRGVAYSLIVFYDDNCGHSKRVLQWLVSSATRMTITQPQISVAILDMGKYYKNVENMDVVDQKIPGPPPNYGTPIIRYIKAVRKSESEWEDEAEDYQGERFSHVLEAWLAQPQRLGPVKQKIVTQ